MRTRGITAFKRSVVVKTRFFGVPTSHLSIHVLIWTNKYNSSPPINKTQEANSIFKEKEGWGTYWPYWDQSSWGQIRKNTMTGTKETDRASRFFYKFSLLHELLNPSHRRSNKEISMQSAVYRISCWLPLFLNLQMVFTNNAGKFTLTCIFVCL
jgi:hypothetical protein